jgi:multiple sugar transport system substrate-binding protein
VVFANDAQFIHPPPQINRFLEVLNVFANGERRMHMLKHKLTVMLGILVLFSMVLSACAPAVPAAQPAAPAVEGEANWWRTAAESAGCVGVTIRGVTESTPPSTYAKDVLGAAFEAASGIKVELETTSWDLMYDKAIKDMEAGTGIYDFVYIEQDIIYAYLANDYLLNMTQFLEDNPGLASPDFDFGKFTTFIDYFKDADGDVYGVPMEAFLKIYLYRTDLFENPDAQTAFLEKYGYDLAPATNYQQYRDNAEFFTQWGQDHGEELWGTTVQAASGHPSSFYEVFETILPSGGVYNWGINMDNWKASVENGGQMNSDRAKEAFQFWLDMLEYAPPEATSSTWDEVAASFAAGRAAQGWVYGENAAWIASDTERSRVVGNVGVALPPLLDESVLADAEEGRGYIGYYDGGAFGIPISSGNQSCAVLWGQFIGQEAVQAEWAAAGSRIVMDATFDDPIVQAMDEQTNGYFTLMREQGRLFAGAPPFPFHATIREVIAPYIYRAIAGELTAADALDQAAAAVDAELPKLGYGQ